MSEVDLSALKMEEGPPPGPPRRPLGPRIALLVLLLVLLATAATFLWPLLRPVRAVATAPVRDAGTESAVARVTTAEAAGWIEPDPFPVIVRPLVVGVLKELLVLEGHAVKAGETVIGRLESADLLAARDRAKADLDRRAAELAEAEAAAAVAAALLDQKADLRLAVATARGERDRDRAKLEARRAGVASAAAALDAVRADLEGQERLAEAGGTYPVALAKARAAVAEAEAEVAARSAEVADVEAELAKADAVLAIAEEVLADPRDLAGTVATTRAAVGKARAERDAARVELAVAERELAWSEVKAPVDGVVMKLLAAPGDEVGALVSLYDPKRIQARVDVQLGDVGGVRVGQDVEVKSEVLGAKTARGTVLRIQRESDLLKNTLQVKVALLDPDPILRPETLVRARFLAPREEAGEGSRGPALFRVPAAAVRDGAVYVLDPVEQRARRVAVERVGTEGDDVVVRGPLSVTQKLILDAVGEGERVKEQGR